MSQIVSLLKSAARKRSCRSADRPRAGQGQAKDSDIDRMVFVCPGAPGFARTFCSVAPGLLLALSLAGLEFQRPLLAQNASEKAAESTSGANSSNIEDDGTASDAAKPASDAPAGEAATADGASAEATPTETATPEDAAEPPPEDPDSRALLVRAEEHYYKGRHHIALKLMQLVIEREPEHPLAYRYAGDIYLKRGELDLAEEHLQIARELSSRPEQEWFRLGQVGYLREDAAAARAAFLEALQLKPDFALCQLYLGFVSFRLERDKAATIEHWTAFRTMAPDHEQGPAVDQALAVLQNPEYEIPEPPQDPEDAEKEPELPETADGKETRVPYQPGDAEEAKSENDGAEIMNIDDL